jgi:biopolymer transport protein ExbD
MIRHGLLSHTRHGSGSGDGGHGPLSLVPMIDILTILVVDLLVHASDAEILSNPRNVAMPMSVSEQRPQAGVVVTVTPEAVLVNDAVVSTVTDLLAAAGPDVEAVRAALVRAADDSGPNDADRTLTVMADRTLPYPVLKRIVASAAGAEFRKVTLAVVEREQALASLAGNSVR